MVMAMASIFRWAACASLIAAGPALAGFTGSGPAMYQKPSSMYAIEAKIHLDRNRLQEATEALTRALHEEPDNVKIAVKLADTYYRLRDYEKVIHILRNYVALSTRDINIFFRLALCFDHRNDFRSALGYYYKALQQDPYLLPAYVKIAQVRLKQGLVFDAAKVLRSVLQIKPDYTPALEELRIVDKLIKDNQHNVYRRGNLVVIFYDYGQLALIEKLFPLMEAHRQNLEDKLGYHIPSVWIKVVKKIERHNGPPAFYDDIEDSIHFSIAALERQDHVLFAHELTWLYLTRMTKKNAPRWLMEGLALIECHPEFVDKLPLRTLELKWIELDSRLTAEKNYLDFERNPEPVQHTLLLSYLLTRFLLENYGWPAMRTLLDEYRKGASQFEKLAYSVLNIPYDALVAKWNMYAITRYYFGAERDFKF